MQDQTERKKIGIEIGRNEESEKKDDENVPDVGGESESHTHILDTISLLPHNLFLIV